MFATIGLQGQASLRAWNDFHERAFTGSRIIGNNREVRRAGIGGAAIDWPVWSSMDWRSAVLTVASIGALFYAKLSISNALTIMAAAG